MSRETVYLPKGCWGPFFEHGKKRYGVELTPDEQRRLIRTLEWMQWKRITKRKGGRLTK